MRYVLAKVYRPTRSPNSAGDSLVAAFADQQQHPNVTSQPVILHPSRVIDELGIAVPGMRIIAPAKLDELKRAVRAYPVALGDGQGRWGEEQAVAAQLGHHRLTAGNLINAYTETPARGQ